MDYWCKALGPKHPRPRRDYPLCLSHEKMLVAEDRLALDDPTDKAALERAVRTIAQAEGRIE